MAPSTAQEADRQPRVALIVGAGDYISPAA
jgi:hypothetical protein